MAFLRGLVMIFAQLLVIHRADFGSFDQHRLQVSIALLGQLPSVTISPSAVLTQ
jgi:hypothetical protein